MNLKKNENKEIKKQKNILNLKVELQIKWKIYTKLQI